MSIFSGVFNTENNTIFDEENSLTLACREHLIIHYCLQNEDIVGGGYANLPGEVGIITSIRTINLEDASAVRSRRSPSETFWWNDSSEESVESLDEDDEDEGETPPEEQETPPHRFFGRVGSPASSARQLYMSSANTEDSVELRVPADDAIAETVRANPLEGYADMVNRSLEMENVWSMTRRQIRPTEETSQARTVSSGFAEAVEVSDRQTRSINPQRRPNIRRGGRRQW